MDELEGTSQLLSGIITVALLLGGCAAAIHLALRQRANPPDRAMLAERIAARSWSTPQVGVVLGALVLLYSCSSFAGLFFYEEQLPVVQLAVTFLIYMVIVALMVLINQRRDRSWSENYGLEFRQLKKMSLSPVFYLASIPFLLLTVFVWHLLLKQVFGVEIELQEVAQMVSHEISWLQILYIVVAIGVAPVFEELLFRGLLFPYLAKRIGIAGGTVLVSMLFAIMHFHLPSLAPLFLLSALFCLAYWYTGSLWPGIGMHAIFNTVNILALNINGS